MTSYQPAAPAPPAPPATGTPEDIAARLDNLNQGIEQATARANARAAAAAGRAGTAGQGASASVVKDGAGRIVVTGPNGKTVVIDPKAGLDGDQIQEVVQTALQPTDARHDPDRIPSAAIPIVTIVFTFLFLIAVVISRTISGRRRGAATGPLTAALAPEAADRLARIEQAVEAVAIEVERISEAQRYSAQLLTERLRDTVPAISGARVEARSVE